MAQRYSQKNQNSKIVMAGAFPPPVHGMAAVNAAVRDALIDADSPPVVINVAARSLTRSLTVRLRRLPRIIGGLLRLATQPGLRGATIYLSVSGGSGQIYEIAFTLLARARGMRIFFHHHSFSYLDRFSQRADALARAGGTEAVHIALSARMARRFSEIYGASRVTFVSNAVFSPHLQRRQITRRRLTTVGFLGNLAPEKGVFDFLDLMKALQERNSPVLANLAGPFQDSETENSVRRRIADLKNTQYVGPQYNRDKEAFYDSIDVLIFPTRYLNEAEPMTLHEAMSNAIPVISYGRGCIPEFVSPDCGLVIDPDQPFVPAALRRLERWVAAPLEFQAASEAALGRFGTTFAENEERWRSLLGDLIGGSVATPTSPSRTAEDWT